MRIAKITTFCGYLFLRIYAKFAKFAKIYTNKVNGFQFIFILKVEQYSEEKPGPEVIDQRRGVVGRKGENLTFTCCELSRDKNMITIRILLKWTDDDASKNGKGGVREYNIFCEDSTQQCSVQDISGEVHPLKPSLSLRGYFMGCATSAQFQIDTLRVPRALTDGGCGGGSLNFKIVAASSIALITCAKRSVEIRELLENAEHLS